MMMINVYSKSESELGRLLSNFARTPFKFRNRIFQSVEAYWYWYMTGEESLCDLWGSQAKRIGRTYANIYGTPIRSVLKLVYLTKLRYNPEIKRMLLESTEEFTHYYVGNDDSRIPTNWMWTAKLWGEIRREMLDMQEKLPLEDNDG